MVLFILACDMFCPSESTSFPSEGYLGHADYQFFCAENHCRFGKFASVAYEVVVLSVEKQVIDVYFACVVERPVENMHAHTLREEVR